MNSTNSSSGIVSIGISANPIFIIVSYCISVLGAFTTFQFVHETKFARAAWRKLLLLACASISMGFCAIWAMHFLGTLCFSFFKVEQTTALGANDAASTVTTALAIEYDLGITIISAVVAVILCFIGFMVSSIQQFTTCFRRYTCCAVFTRHDRELDMMDGRDVDSGNADLELEDSLTSFRSTIVKADHSPEELPSVTKSTDAASPKVKSSRRLKLHLHAPTKAEWKSYVLGSSQKPHLLQLIISSFFNAAGVCTMHYLGMLATHIQNTKMVWNGWLVALACVIAYVASFAAFWISFNLKNHVFKVMSSFVAACAVAGMHYTGMMSCSYEYSSAPQHMMLSTTKSNVSNTDLAMGTTIVTSVACFFLLVMLTAARNVLNKTINHLKREKRTVDKYSSQLQSTVVQMNTLLNQVAFEEHQIRKVMDCLSDPVCVVDEYGNLMKANRQFKTVTSIGNNGESKHTIVDFFPEVERMSMSTYYDKLVGSQPLPSVELSMTLKTMFHEQLVQVAIHHEHHQSNIHQSVNNNNNMSTVDRSFYIWIIQNESIKTLQYLRGSNLFSQNSSSFDDDLADAEFYPRFKAFCVEEHCCEGLLFLEKVNAYKACENTMERIELQKQVAAEFLEIESPNQLNLPRKVLHDTLERIKIAYGQVDLFDDICKQVKELLQHSYTRFKTYSTRH